MKKPRFPHVEVEWDDAFHDNVNTKVISSIPGIKIQKRRSAGYLMHKDDSLVIIASDVEYNDEKPDEEPEFECYWVIPTGWVSAIHYLGKKAAPKPKKVKESTNAKD